MMLDIVPQQSWRMGNLIQCSALVAYLVISCQPQLGSQALPAPVLAMYLRDVIKQISGSSCS